VASQILVWRLDDEGLAEVFRASNPLQLSPQALGSDETLLTLESEDGFKLVIDASGKRLPDLACRWIARPFTPVALRLPRWSFPCPARGR
jgi:hypothetical protein